MLRAYARYARTDPERELIERHGALLDRCARRIAARTGHAVQPEDLWSAGALGLLEAGRRFEPGRDVRFEAFAEHRIRGAMLDELRRMDHLPRRLRDDADAVERARANLGRQLGREPTVDELSEAMGTPAEDVGALLQLLQPAVPVEEELAAADSPGADAAIERAERQRALAGAIAGLPERLQILLALYYDEGLTYREIAKVMHVSEPRVCQLHSEAVKRLRGDLPSESP